MWFKTPPATPVIVISPSKGFPVGLVFGAMQGMLRSSQVFLPLTVAKGHLLVQQNAVTAMSTTWCILKLDLTRIEPHTNILMFKSHTFVD